MQTLGWAILGLSVAVSVSSCGTADAPLSETGTPERTSSSAVANDGLKTALALSRVDATLSGFLDRAERGIEPSGEHFTSPGWRGVGSGPARIAARISPRANASLHVGLGPNPTTAIEIERQGASPSEPSLVAGRAHFSDAYPSTDLVSAATMERYEELLVLKDERAPRSFAFRFQLPSAIPQVSDQPDGALLFLDASGQPAIRVDKPFLLDAQGTRRDAKLRLDGDRFVIDVDTRGLAFPILLDPAYDVAVWTQVTSAAPPPGRYGHAMTLHGANVLINGGYDGFFFLNDSWTFNGTAWTAVASGPPGRRYAAMAYDVARGETVLFGGYNLSAVQGLSDTWIYTGGVWTEKCTTCVSGTEEPSMRYGHQMVYDSVLQRVLLFAGNAAGVGESNDLWEWNGATAKWSKRCNGACVAPPARTLFGMAYDANAARTVVYGGTSVGGLRQDTRLYNSATDTWTDAAPLNSPGLLQMHAMTYDTIRKKVILFAGRDVSSSLNGTWQWNGSNWSTVDAPTKPGARASSPLVFDPGLKKAVLFSGSVLGSLNPPSETYTLYVRGDSCSVGTTCDTGFCVDGVCCVSSACGTCEACNASGSNPLTTAGTCTKVLNASDPDTCTGTSSCDGAGACKKAQGQVCSAGSECSNGNCVDGRCCGSPSCGACLSCANAAGTCTTAVTSQDDDACTGTKTCNAAGQCRDKNGQTCSGASTCASGYCFDSTCCATDCTTACRSCANASGTCSAVTNADDPPSCTGTTSCDGSGNCKKKNGQGCAAGSECLSGNCVDSYCCDGACAGGCDVCAASLGASQNGTCTVLASGATGQCGAYKCGGAASCPTTCSSDTQCASGNYCDGNACQPKKSNGSVCSGDNQCTSTHCADNVCCDTACTGKCMACSAGNKQDGNPANAGTCGAAKVGTNPGNQCVLSTDPCGEQNSCSGTPGQCALGASGKSCGPTTCVNGSVTGKICNGAGLCTDQTNIACAPYVCKGSACSSPCTADTDCVTDYYCSNGVCVAKVDNGKGCDSTKPSSCKSAFCVDQVCCDSPCSGQCQACAETGSLGQCKVVTGKPREPRTDCLGVTGDKCKGACDGTSPNSCSYPAAGTACKDASCNGDVAQPAGACDGVGLCALPTTKNCLPYACDSTAGDCKASCAGDTDCAQGATCNTTTGKCAVAGATCKDATTVALPNGQTQSCSPYKCVGGACQQQCATPSDCAPGYTCQGNACVPGSDAGSGGSGGGSGGTGAVSTGGSSTGGTGTKKKTDSGDDGGCGCRVPARGGDTHARWLGLAALALLRRRRSRRGVAPRTR